MLSPSLLCVYCIRAAAKWKQISVLLLGPVMFEIQCCISRKLSRLAITPLKFKPSFKVCTEMLSWNVFEVLNAKKK
jgi:hypothetical protein